MIFYDILNFKCKLFFFHYEGYSSRGTGSQKGFFEIVVQNYLEKRAYFDAENSKQRRKSWQMSKQILLDMRLEIIKMKK